MNLPERSDLILAKDLARHGDDPRRTQRAARAGSMKKVHRGAYIDAAAWETASGEHATAT